MFSVILGAAILGIIIALMEQGSFPGWGVMVICVLAAAVPAMFVNALLPDELFFVGPIVGAVCAGFAISATCGMSVARAMIAAAIYLVIQAGISFAFYAMLHAK